MKEPKPPKWAERLLIWYCKPELLEDLQGDLNEYFQRNLSKGIYKAKLIYIVDVFKFFRLYTIRKPKYINYFIQWLMIKSYLKTSGRNILRNKLFSTINIFGLAVSMSVGLLLIGLLNDMYSYDRFHENGNRIYRVISKYIYLKKEDDNFFASSSPLAGKEIRETVSGIEAVTQLHTGFEGDVKTTAKTVPLQGLWADEDFLKIFSFEMLEGNAATALKNQFSVVLTETSAKKLFGDESALGKVVSLKGGKEFTVTGVLKDLPKFSHIRFEMLGSYSTRLVTNKSNYEMSWDNIWSGYTYVLLPQGTDMENLQSNLNVLSKKNDKTLTNVEIRLSLQPLFNIALGTDHNNSLGAVMSESEVWMIGTLCIVVILSACFNYTNLSLARATRRSREVGIRKAIGAQKGQVFSQFVFEAILISLLALGVAIVIFILLKPYFLQLLPKMQRMLELRLSPRLILYFALLALAVGVVAGVLPAFLLSKINTIQALRDSSSLRMFRHINLRKTLVVLQYTISLVFIGSTIIALKQYKYLVNYDLGYTTENIINIELKGNKPARLMQKLREIPEVENVSESVIITSLGFYWSTSVKYQNLQDSADVYYNGVDENYIPLHNIKLIAGRNFEAKRDSVQETEVIVNVETLKKFDIAKGNPEQALNEEIIVDRRKLKIIGVIKDFNYSKAENKTNEVILRYYKNQGQYLNVKVSSTDWLSIFSKIEAAWKEIDDVHPLDAQLFQDRIKQSYSEISAMAKMMGFLAFLAICISSLGLLGMVIFTTEARLKEISIRKVMGAGESKIVYLLSKSFLVLLGLSGAIAMPVIYFFFQEVVFQEIPNHIAISIFDMLVGFSFVLLIALIMIGSQTLKAARTNPAAVLKNE